MNVTSAGNELTYKENICLTLKKGREKEDVLEKCNKETFKYFVKPLTLMEI